MSSQLEIGTNIVLNTMVILKVNEDDLVMHASPRASLVLAVAALEVGTKRTIAQIAPSTEWLLERPTPPIDQLLESYLPKLYRALPSTPPLHGILKIPETHMKLVHQAIQGSEPRRASRRRVDRRRRSAPDLRS